ncbi:MAG: NAD(P)-dependent oxidoreductase [Arenicella sp.]
MANKTVGVVGLGNMGSGMAQSLLRNGFKVVGADVGSVQKDNARSLGITVVDTLKAVCQETDIIILSLPMAKHVQEVIVGDQGLLKYAQSSSLVVDTSTSEPDVTRTLAAKMSEAGHSMLDCPVSGGPAGAKSGTMVMLVGGETTDLNRAEPVLKALTSKIVHLGASGNGHVGKLINNLLCASHLLTTAEAMSLANNAGLSQAALAEALNAGSGRSAISEINYPKWILNEAFDSGFSMQLMRKDLRLAMDLVGKMGVDTPLSKQAAAIWHSSESEIADNEDFNRIVSIVGEKS